MKNYPLSLQIWLVIAIITLTISTLLAFILPTTLKDFFTKEIYATISSAQDLVFNQFEGNIYRDYIGSDFFGVDEEVLNNIRTVRHFIIYDKNKVILDSNLPVEFVERAQDQALSQKADSLQYSLDIRGEKIFYIISKGRALGYDAYFVSFMGDSYREDLVQTLFTKLISVMVIVLLFSWVPALLLSRYISRPLVNLEKRVEKLANNDWAETINIDRKDEIGRLGNSVEHLRKQLIRQDEAEQSFLQHISHELKTPVMVIQSYTEAIKDGIYPRGDLSLSLDVISQEGKRLEGKIKNLLYLTKLNYLSSHQMVYEDFSLSKVIEDTIEKFKWYRKDVDWIVDLDDLTLRADMDQWTVVIENLLDNQVRYAKSKIGLSLKSLGPKSILRIWNDGPGLEDDLVDNLFDKYNKGHKGEFGLGLAIVHRIVTSHQASIYYRNEEEGLSFYIEFMEG